MTIKRNIIFSYDYELFFGEKSGTVQKSIIEPTNLLMDVMEEKGFRGNFFVDYLMFRELEKLSGEQVQRDLQMLKDQIRDMVRRGHRIELHLHPHWIDAKYNGDGTWNFDNYSHYSLSSLDEETIVDMFKTGTTYLTILAREVDPDYRIVAFRAGGWAVQPFDKLKRAFLESGIIIDSSTSFGLYKYMKDSYYDFRSMPDKAVYRFEDDVCKEVADGRFIEVPITSRHLPIMFFVYDAICRKIDRKRKPLSDGTHYRKNPHEEKKSFSTKLLEKMDNSYKTMLNFSFLSSASRSYFYWTLKNDTICFIDHPKDVCMRSISGIEFLPKDFKSINYMDILQNN